MARYYVPSQFSGEINIAPGMAAGNQMAALMAQMKQQRRQNKIDDEERAKQKLLGTILSNSYDKGGSVEKPFVDEQAQFMGQESPDGLVESRDQRPAGMDWHKFIGEAFKSGLGLEAIQIAKQANKEGPQEYTLGEIGAGGDNVQSVVFNKQTGRYEAVGEPRKKSGTPDWMMPGYFDAMRRKSEIDKDAKKGKLPPAALKMQQEELDAIGTSSGIKSDLGSLASQIETGGLKLGPVANIESQARNLAGMSSPESRAFSSFRSTLEKLRNDSLRLNKGVQTEGDAQRAWNELVANINDPQVVQKRLQEIQDINERAVMIRKMNIENIRRNYGLESLDVSGYESVKPAVGGEAQAKFRIPKGARTATDTATGRKVYTIDNKTFYDAETGKRVE